VNISGACRFQRNGARSDVVVKIAVPIRSLTSSLRLTAKLRWKRDDRIRRAPVESAFQKSLIVKRALTGFALFRDISNLSQDINSLHSDGRGTSRLSRIRLRASLWVFIQEYSANSSAERMMGASDQHDCHGEGREVALSVLTEQRAGMAPHGIHGLATQKAGATAPLIWNRAQCITGSRMTALILAILETTASFLNGAGSKLALAGFGMGTATGAYLPNRGWYVMPACPNPHKPMGRSRGQQV